MLRSGAKSPIISKALFVSLVISFSCPSLCDSIYSFRWSQVSIFVVICEWTHSSNGKENVVPLTNHTRLAAWPRYLETSCRLQLRWLPRCKTSSVGIWRSRPPFTTSTIPTVQWRRCRRLTPTLVETYKKSRRHSMIWSYSPKVTFARHRRGLARQLLTNRLVYMIPWTFICFQSVIVKMRRKRFWEKWNHKDGN